MRYDKSELVEQLLRQWERLVQAHQRWKEDPSAQCAWGILKLAGWIVFQLMRYYIR